MSPDTSWRKRRSCMTEADCARPPRGGSSPPGSEILEYLCFRRLSSIARATHGRTILLRSRRIAPGKVGAVLPDEARESCQKVLGNMAHGRHPLHGLGGDGLTARAIRR